MAEGLLNESLPDLKELEHKVGMKTPESLLTWMRDAAHCEEGWRSDVVDRGDSPSTLISDSFSDKIRNLKQEMRCLRSADVRILRQLVAVHEGIEAMRWMMEERGTGLASRGSSLTGSQSSLVTVDGPGPSCRESPSPICLEDPYDTNTAGDESADPALNNHSNVSDPNYFDTLSHTSSDARPTSRPGSKFSCSTQVRHRQARSGRSPATASSSVGSNSLKLQPRVSGAAPLQDFKPGAEPIRRALVRSRRGLKVDGGCFAHPKHAGETQTHHDLPKERLRACRSRMTEEEDSKPSREGVLLGYDAQWHWVESQDDVTFL